MKSTILDWIQVTAGIAILAGLVLVIFELKQSQELTKLQLISSGFEMRSNQRIAIMGENAAQIIQKSCEAPANLTKAELQILDAYHLELINRIRIDYRYSEVSDIYSEEDWSRGYLNFYTVLSTFPGRVWWQGQTWIEPPVRSAGNAIYEKLKDSNPSCEVDYAARVQAAKKLAEQTDVQTTPKD